jgi:hypothetical protein
MSSPKSRIWFLWGAILGALAGLGLALFQPLLARRRAAYQRYLTQADTPPHAHPPADTTTLSTYILDEVVRAFGFPADSWQRPLLAPILQPASRSFARLALRFDDAVGHHGLGAAFAELLTYAVTDLHVSGAETIPARGPLLILSNHPGAYDGGLIAASLPRQDLLIISSTVPFAQRLPNFHSHLIEVTREPHAGMRGLRQAVRHLQAGGALLILPSGIIDPDPDLLPGASAALEQWKPSIELLLRQVPETQAVVTIVSGVLSPGWLRSPLVKIQPEPWRQRKLAEFLQIIQQVLLPGTLLLSPRVSVASPVTAAELAASGSATTLHQALIQRAQSLLATHMAAKQVSP